LGRRGHAGGLGPELARRPLDGVARTKAADGRFRGGLPARAGLRKRWKLAGLPEGDEVLEKREDAQDTRVDQRADGRPHARIGGGMRTQLRRESGDLLGQGG